jgi:hypothetical protein
MLTGVFAQPVMLRFNRILLLLSFMLSGLPLVAEPKGAISNAVTVVDLEVAGGHPGVGDWALGLADVLAPETARGSVGNGDNNSALTEP